MPIYPYVCTACKVEFEIKKPVAVATHPQICPECCSVETKRVFTPPGIIIAF